MDTVHEEWRPVPGAADRYSVSNLGRVRREVFADSNGRVRPRGIVTGSADTCGYLRIRRVPVADDGPEQDGEGGQDRVPHGTTNASANPLTSVLVLLGKPSVVPDLRWT